MVDADAATTVVVTDAAMVAATTVVATDAAMVAATTVVATDAASKLPVIGFQSIETWF